MTNKQKELAKKILENPSLTMKDAMLEVGYSKNTAIAPQNVTESKGWKELMDQYLPDAKLLNVHKKGLEATKIVTSHTEPDREVPDFAVRAKYLELGYKVKGYDKSSPIQILNQGEMDIEFIK